MRVRFFLGFFALCFAGFAFANKVNFVPLDTWGDYRYTKIVVENQKAYVASDGIVILDVSDETQVTELGKVTVDSYQFIQAIRVIGNLAVLVERSRIYLIDVTNSSQPAITGSIDYPGANGFTDAVVLNNRLYASAEDQSLIYVYDIESPAAPTLLTSKSMANLGTNSVSLGVVNDKLVYSGPEGISILSTGTDTFLNVLYSDEQQVNNFVSRIPSKSNVSYFINGADILVYDFTDLSSVSVESITTGTSNIADISLSGNSLIVVDSIGKAYHFDVTAANAPVLQSQGGDSFTNSSIALDQGFIYLVNSFEGMQSRYLSNLSKAAEYNNGGTLYDLDIYQDTAAIAAGGQGLKLLDLAGQTMQLTAQQSSGYFLGLEFVNNFLYDDVNNVRDTNSSFPMDSVAYYAKTFDGTGVVEMEDTGNRLFIATYGGISIFDVSNPTNPVELAYISASTFSAGASSQIDAIKVDGNVVYAGTTAGVYVVDFSDPSDIQYSSRIGANESARSLDLKDSSLLVAYSSMLNSYDISNPMEAVFQSQVALPAANNTTSLRVYKNWAIIDSTAENIITVDISDPASLAGFEVQNSGFVPHSKEISIYNNQALFITEGQVKRFQINEAPQASDSNHQVNEDTSLIAEMDVVDLEADSVELSLVTLPEFGEVTLNNDGSFEYMPNENYYGNDMFEYQAVDPHGGDNSAAVSITILPVNDAPIANDDSLSVQEGDMITRQFAASDVDGDVLTFEIESGPAQGTLTITGSEYSYQAPEGVLDTQQFRYRVTDSAGASAEASVTINVTSKPKSGSSSFGVSLLLLVFLLSRRHIALR